MSLPTLPWLATRLKLRHYSLLIELDRSRSVSRAAERLGLAQPTVTRSLREIEDIFMTQLFTRSRRGLEPTSAGLLVLARARLALADADGLGQDLAALGSGLQGRLRVGVIPFLSRQTHDSLKPPPVRCSGRCWRAGSIARSADSRRSVPRPDWSSISSTTRNRALWCHAMQPNGSRGAGLTGRPWCRCSGSFRRSTHRCAR